MIIDGGASGLDRGQEFAERGHIEMIACGQEVSPDEVLGLDRKDAMERARRRDDAQLLVQDDQRLANGGDDAVEIGARGLDLSFGGLHLGNAGERDDHPLDAAVVAPIGQHAAHEPAAVVGLDLAPDRRVACQHRSCIRQEIVVLEPARQVGKRPADVGSDDVEQRLRGRREEADVQVAIQEECRHVGAVEDVLKVVGRGALLLDRLVQLAIEGRELLVEGLQLLLRRFQFLVGRLEFLVDRHGLFIDRLLLLVGDLEVANGALQVLACGFELLLELSNARRVGCRFNRSDGSRLRRRIVDEADEKQSLAIALDRPGSDAYCDRAPIALDVRPGDGDARVDPALARWIADLSLARNPSRAMASTSRVPSPEATFR